MHFRIRFVYFKSCQYNLCIFARDLSIFRVVDIIYAFLRDTYPYYYGDVAIIYAFSHEICLFLRVVDIIYALSRNITLITTEMQL